MNYTYQVLSSRPRQNQLELEALMVCLRACAACAQSCVACAHACLDEVVGDELVTCIRLSLDCVDVCLATGRLLSGLTAVDLMLWRNQLQACRAACQRCAEACSQHTASHEHCWICAETCHQCERACQSLLATLARM